MSFSAVALPAAPGLTIESCVGRRRRPCTSEKVAPPSRVPHFGEWPRGVHHTAPHWPGRVGMGRDGKVQVSVKTVNSPPITRRECDGIEDRYASGHWRPLWRHRTMPAAVNRVVGTNMPLIVWSESKDISYLMDFRSNVWGRFVELELFVVTVQCSS